MLLTPLVLCVSLCGPTAGQEDPFDVSDLADRWTMLEGTRPAQWRVVWTEAPQTRAVIAWTTAEEGSEHRVLYGDGPAGEPLALEHAADRSGAYPRKDTDISPPAWYHHARLEGLRADTVYRFVIESDGQRSAELHFRTAPDDAQPFALLVGGDSRSGTRARVALNEAIARRVAADPALLAFSHGGDYVMYGDSFDNWSAWASHYELTTAADGRVLPIVPTRGNHDFGPLFGCLFDDPGGADRHYYRTRFSPLLSLFTLNSNISAGGDQLEWLEQTIAAAAGDSTYLIPNYHRALYPAVKLPGDAAPFWLPVFDTFQVDLALESDGHVLKRSVPIRDGKQHPDGVVYVGEGGLGVPQRLPRERLWYLEPPGFATSAHHVLRLDVTPKRLGVEFLVLPPTDAANDPARFTPVIAPGAEWAYRLGELDDALAWAAPDFDDSDWPRAPAGFGYGDADDRTELPGMHRTTAELRARASFEADDVELPALNLICRYDDAFIAYLNGTEVARGGFEPSEDGPKVANHEATSRELFELTGWRELAVDGPDVLAIVGLNRSRGSSDFTLDPCLVAAQDSPATGEQGAAAALDLKSFEPFELRPKER